MKIKTTLCSVTKWLSLFFSNLVIANAFQTVDRGYLTIGIHHTYNCALYNFFNGIAQQHGLGLKWHIDKNFDHITQKMKQRVFDVSAHGISNINQLTVFNTPASTPYLKVRRGFTVLKNSSFAHSNKLPQGATVALMNNSTALQDIQKNYPPGFFNLKIVDTITGSTRAMLRAKKIDAIAEGHTGFWFNTEDEKDLVMIDPHPLDTNNPEAEALVFWVQPGNTALLDKINHKLKQQGNIYGYYQQNGVCKTAYALPAAM